MDILNPHEARVLGVLIEKELTTPDLYPLTLNATTNACNQKSNRYPVMSLDEATVLDALERLRGKGLVIFVDAIGARSSKFRQQARERLGVGIKELVILAELLLRGPQTVGELRTRASRMHELDSMEVVANTLELMISRDDPLVERLAPATGSRAQRFSQLLSPDSNPRETDMQASIPTTAKRGTADEISSRLSEVEGKVEMLSEIVRKLAKALGEEGILENEEIRE